MKSEYLVAIGKKLAEYRMAKQMTQKALCKDICAPSSISQMENGIFMLSADILQPLCDRLEIHMEDLIEGYQHELEVPVYLEIIKVQVERADYRAAFKMIEEVERRDDLGEDEQRRLVLYQSDCLMRTGKAEDAITYLTDLQKELEQKRDVDDHLLAEVYNLLGSAHYFAAHIINAHACYWRAYNISLRFPFMNDLAAKIAFNLGVIYRLMGNTKFAYEYFSMAEKYFVGASDTKRLAMLLFEQGIMYVKRSEWEKAKTSLNESYALYKSLKNWQMVQHVRQVVAFTILAPEHPSLAIRELLDCAQEFERLEDAKFAAYTYVEASSVQIDQGLTADAEQSLQRALKIYPDNSPDIVLAFIYRVRAKFLLHVKQYSECIEKSLESIQLYDKIGLERESAETMELIVKSYEEQGAIEKALATSKRMYEILRSSYFGKFQS